MTKAVSVFKSTERKFVRYLGGDSPTSSKGDAWIARLVGTELSNTMGAGVVVYERVTVDWNFSFDEVITLLEGELRIHSAGAKYDLLPGDLAWFPANTPLSYEVKDRAVVSYVVYPIPSKPTTTSPTGRGSRRSRRSRPEKVTVKVRAFRRQKNPATHGDGVSPQKVHPPREG